MNIPALSLRRAEDRLRMISLSGGGYRAMLYHAGVMRVLADEGWLDAPGQSTVLCAVSGGSITANVWDLNLSREPESTNQEPLWPERMLLRLLELSPRLGGRVGTYVRNQIRRSHWQNVLAHWWHAVEASFAEVCKPKRHPMGIDRRPPSDGGLCVLTEAVNFLNGQVYVFNRSSIVIPDRELFKSGKSFSETRFENGLTPFALRAATALPGYFRPVRIALSTNIKDYQTGATLVDAGLIDNLAMHPLLPLLTKNSAGESIVQRGDTWLLFNAGKPDPLIGALGGVILPSNRRHRLSLTDRIFRLTGDLAQPNYVFGLTRLINDYTPLEVRGTRIDVPTQEEPLWLPTKHLPDAAAVAAVATSVNRMRREDAIGIMSWGAQSACGLLGLDSSRTGAIRAKFEQLQKG